MWSLGVIPRREMGLFQAGPTCPVVGSAVTSIRTEDPLVPVPWLCMPTR